MDRDPNPPAAAGETGVSQDWADALMADVPAVAPNPHYHCSSASTTPCPTGEHRNPFGNRGGPEQEGGSRW